MSEQPMTFTDQAAPIAALVLLQATHRELPAVSADFSTIVPNRLDLAFHHRPGAFDAWFAAIAPEGVEVTDRIQGDGRTRTRQAVFPYAGVELHLVEYTHIEAGGES